MRVAVDPNCVPGTRCVPDECAGAFFISVRKMARPTSYPKKCRLGLEDAARLGAASCPERAITVWED